VLGVATFFIQKWIQSIDETIKEHGKDLYSISKQITQLETKSENSSKNISTTITTEIHDLKAPLEKISELSKELVSLKTIVTKNIVPKINHLEEEFGRVAVVEDKLREQDKKLLSMFQVVKVVKSKQDRG
jgi:Mg2+ and Co2+ transporter CorA